MWNEDLDCIWRELARDIDTKKFNDGKGDDGKTILGNKSKFNSFQGKLKNLEALKMKAVKVFNP